ncbi:hypothetical protein HDV57DRAFT_7042 [Trichoderma longibrachiatum]|uniref:Uncharacterized protein n=1 Tax=Trichoderma longibrachiatum ATCC 18648 TaxID=983965 RepID=A0A2T4CJT2_TRILO|nr:hypothetical protein M440DRAFT_92191 [Trichoderma longibrachiatum ATCC 18648]
MGPGTTCFIEEGLEERERELARLVGATVVALWVSGFKRRGSPGWPIRCGKTSLAGGLEQWLPAQAQQGDVMVRLEFHGSISSRVCLVFASVTSSPPVLNFASQASVKQAFSQHFCYASGGWRLAGSC